MAILEGTAGVARELVPPFDGQYAVRDRAGIVQGAVAPRAAKRRRVLRVVREDGRTLDLGHHLGHVVVAHLFEGELRSVFRIREELAVNHDAYHDQAHFDAVGRMPATGAGEGFTSPENDVGGIVASWCRFHVNHRCVSGLGPR
jgi:hypothetical protein